MIEAFKTEIIEAEKSRIDLLKWKLIIVASLISIGFGIGQDDSAQNTVTISPQYALALAPLVATYVDLLCTHLQFRILVISEYFQNRPESDNEEMSIFISYEKFCGKVRGAFGLEDFAQVFFTVILSVLVAIAAFFKGLSCIYYYSSVFGVVAPILLFYYYRDKAEKLHKKKSIENVSI